ncbi:MAG: hypothetical protein O7D91_11525 [Planctomycetota bacterium]|nr:hypothetical protein [Planctomycetota bacterium]
MIEKPLDEITKVMIRRTAKRFLKWFWRDVDKVESFKNGSLVVNKKRINKSTLLKPHEIQLMLHRAEKLRDKVLLVLLYDTAARPQERFVLYRHGVFLDSKIN